METLTLSRSEEVLLTINLQRNELLLEKDVDEAFATRTWRDLALARERLDQTERLAFDRMMRSAKPTAGKRLA